MDSAPHPIWVTLPTFNEAGNIESLIKTLLALRSDLGVVVIDDNSPDGTWRIVQDMEDAYPGRVVLVHRVGEKGRGSAGVAGFKKAIDLGARLIVEMDADWSHDPRFLPGMIAMAEGTPSDGARQSAADVVVGSRLTRGGGEHGRSFVRTLITYAANFYIRLVLGLPIRDCTSGYRVFRASVLDGIDWDRIDSNGPAIVQEVLLACRAQKARIVEFPILFEPRRTGQSTFNARIMLAGLGSVLKFRLRRPAIKEQRRPAAQGRSGRS